MPVLWEFDCLIYIFTLVCVLHAPAQLTSAASRFAGMSLITELPSAEDAARPCPGTGTPSDSPAGAADQGLTGRSEGRRTARLQSVSCNTMLAAGGLRRFFIWFPNRSARI